MSAGGHATERRHTVEEAVRFLAGRCDWAQTDDGVGYNASDTSLGHQLADLPDDEWTAAERRAAWEMLRKYEAQLASAGIDYDALPEPPVPDDVDGGRTVRDAARLDLRERQEPRRVEWDDEADRWLIRFAYDRELVATVKDVVDGRRWNGDAKRWEAPANGLAAAGLLRLADEHGFDLSDDDRARAERQAGVVRDLGERHVRLEGGALWVVFPFDREAKDALKREVAGARWNPDEGGGVWQAPRDSAAEVADWAERHGVALAPEVERLAAEQADRERALREASEAEDADRLPVEDRLGGELYPFQRAGVAYAAQAGRVMIADEMGLGKTVQALAAVEQAGAYPAVVVVPATLKANWQREVERWLPHRSVQVVEGQDAHTTRADVVVVNYAILGHRVEEVVDEDEGETRERYPWVEALRMRDLRAVVLDESHYVKNASSNRSKAAAKLAAGVGVRLLLTGTPVLNRPAELIHQLRVLGRFEEVGGNWRRFVTRYCAGYRGRFGWDVSGASHLDELNGKLRASCYVRRRKADVLTELPAKRRALVPVEIGNRPEYERARRDLVAWLVENAGAAKADAALRAEQLARINYLKQLAARGKMRAAVQWVEDFLESGEKLVLFAHHREVQDRLYEAFADRAVRISGGDDAGDRQAAVDAFQTDDGVRLMVASLKAAGVGLTLTAASNVAFVELGWTPADHDQAEDRVHRIGQDEAVVAWYLMAEDTIDEEIYRLIQRKRDVVSRATEGGEAAGQASLLSDLVGALTEGVDDG